MITFTHLILPVKANCGFFEIKNEVISWLRGGCLLVVRTSSVPNKFRD